MSLLILGLILFLGTHSVRIVADGWRTRTIARLGEGAWKGLYTLLSLAGLALIVWGYGRARLDPLVLWASPTWTRHLAALLVLVALVLIVASQVPGNSIRARLHHPMVLGVKVWAFAHLLANNTLADLLLFGGFLAWAIVDFASARRRDRADGKVYPPGRLGPTLAVVGIGLAVYLALVMGGHAWLFGVRPFS